MQKELSSFDESTPLFPDVQKHNIDFGDNVAYKNKVHGSYFDDNVAPQSESSPSVFSTSPNYHFKETFKDLIIRRKVYLTTLSHIGNNWISGNCCAPTNEVIDVCKNLLDCIWGHNSNWTKNIDPFIYV